MEDETGMFGIRFADLNEDAQKRLLEFMKISSLEEANWDTPGLDIIAYVCNDNDEYDDDECGECGK